MSLRAFIVHKILTSFQPNYAYNISKPIQNLTSSCACQQLYYSLKPVTPTTKFIDPATGEEKKRKTTIIPKITLLQSENISITTLDEAQKIAKRRDLKLVKIVDLDTKTQRPVYKLMTGTEYHAEDLKQRQKKKEEKQNSFLKGEKVLMINTKISEHDLNVNINKITKWIAKMYEVRTVINGERETADKICDVIENSLRNQARFLQKRYKGQDLRFQILPMKKEKSDNDDGNTKENPL